MALAQPGYGSANQLRFVVKNTSGTDIPEGYAVQLASVVDSPLGDLTGQGVMEKIPVATLASANDVDFYGITTGIIQTGKFGEICVSGLVRAWAVTNVAANARCGPDAGGLGKLDDAATAGLYFYSLEATTTSEAFIWGLMLGTIV